MTILTCSDPSLRIAETVLVLFPLTAVTIPWSTSLPDAACFVKGRCRRRDEVPLFKTTVFPGVSGTSIVVPFGLLMANWPLIVTDAAFVARCGAADSVAFSGGCDPGSALADSACAAGVIDSSRIATKVMDSFLMRSM